MENFTENRENLDDVSGGAATGGEEAGKAGGSTLIIGGKVFGDLDAGALKRGNPLLADDVLVTGIAADGFVRFTAAESTATCEKARIIHGTSALATAALGRALTAAALLSSQLKNETDSVSIQINGKGPLGKIVTISDVKARVRGYVANPKAELPLRVSDGKIDVAAGVGKGFLQIIKDLSLKEPYIGTSALVSGEIAEDLTYYFAASEQVPSSVALGVRIGPDPDGKEPFRVEKAGGFIIQLMPGAPDSLIDDLEKRIGGMPSVTTLLAAGATATDIVKDIFKGYSPEIQSSHWFGYVCGCSRGRMQAALAAVGRKDLTEIYEDGHGAELCCNFCNKKYFFSTEEIGEMLAQQPAKPEGTGEEPDGGTAES